jgi:uncharacterized delta-60 repeat protein
MAMARRLLVAGSLPILLAACGSQATVGALDTSFGSGGTVLTHFGASALTHAVSVQRDGKIVLVGSSGNDGFAVARYTSSGAPDHGFGTGGKVSARTSLSYEGADAVAFQPDGKIVVAGSSASGSGDFRVTRYTKSGALDRGFGRGGKVLTDFGPSRADVPTAVAVQPDGKIVVAGLSELGLGATQFALARYTKSGALDRGFGRGGKVLTSFGSSDYDTASAVALQPDGKIVVAGYSTANETGDFAVARYTKRGVLDTSFGRGGTVLTDFGFDDEALALALQPDGKIVVAGYSSDGSGSDLALARYTTSGALDPGFGTRGKVLTPSGSSSDDAAGAAVVVQPDGRIVVAGYSGSSSTGDVALARYTKSGALDPRFGAAVRVLAHITPDITDGDAVAIQQNGKILLAGLSDATGSQRFALPRYLSH